ncbi:MAG: carbohydrate kinase family protein [Ruminococcaceae bacterium]|nr:carbohydrate kinase family protein [Oscillospiraceae bacterium]
MNKGIAVVGNILVDHIKMIDSYPVSGMLTNIRSVSRSVGGCACNTGAALAKIDPEMNVVVIGKIGNDADGDYIKGVLSGLGVNIDGVITVDDKPTSFSDVMTDISSNERTLFRARGANADFDITDIDFDKLDVDIFHIGYALLLDKFDEPDDEYGTVMARTLAYVSERGIKTSMDVVSEAGDRFNEVVAPCLPYCDYLIFNEVEASRITGISVRDENGKISHSAMKQVIVALFEKGVREVVSIHAPEGGWYSRKGEGVYFQQCLNMTKDMIKGKVGVGDSFCAGMLYSLYREFDPEYSLRVAGAAAACNLTEANSIDGLRTFDKMMEFESEIGYEAE